MDIISEFRNQFEISNHFPKTLGIELLDLAPGYARLAMKVRADMVNFHGIGHGGVIFSLADTAMGLACNTHGSPAVVMTSTIDYLVPAHIGERLEATAQEQYRSHRTGNYLISVNSGDSKLIALIRGITYFKSESSDAEKLIAIK